MRRQLRDDIWAAVLVVGGFLSAAFTVAIHLLGGTALMSIESLMVHEVTLLTQDGESQNEIGETFPTYSSLETTMYLEPTHGGVGSGFSAGREIEAERNTPIGDWLGIGRADIDWDSTQRVLYNEHTFDLIAPPRYMPNPRLDTISHVELSLQEIDTVENVDAIATPNVVGGGWV